MFPKLRLLSVSSGCTHRVQAAFPKPALSRTMTVRSKPPQVHVLGLGSIGTFAAHSLSEIPSPLTPSVTLLLHRPSLVGEYRKNGNKIALETRENERVEHSNFNLEVLQGDQWYSVPAADEHENMTPIVRDGIIDHLIVSVKGAQTVAALEPLKHRLNASSHILFLQNGSGMMEEVSEKVFLDPRSRPNYVIGVISHGVTLNSPFHITHTGFAATSLGPVPRKTTTSVETGQEARLPYLLEALPMVPRLNATSYSFLDAFQMQLEKLAVNAFCNPLCALNDAKNKFLFTIPETRKALLTEISNVIQALPELQGLQGVSSRFAVDRLESTVNAILTKTAETTCSMVVDLRRGQRTEVEFINGYWCRRAREVGIPTPINDSLVRQILERQGYFERSKKYQ